MEKVRPTYRCWQPTFKSLPHPLSTSDAGIIFGQDVCFLGFPYCLHTELGEVNRNFPLPFIKKSTFSASDDKWNVLYLDGDNNPGFSGGPVVFLQQQKPSKKSSVAGVILDFHPRMKPVYLERNSTALEF